MIEIKSNVAENLKYRLNKSGDIFKTAAIIDDLISGIQQSNPLLSGVRLYREAANQLPHSVSSEKQTQIVTALKSGDGDTVAVGKKALVFLYMGSILSALKPHFTEDDDRNDELVHSGIEYILARTGILNGNFPLSFEINRKIKASVKIQTEVQCSFDRSDEAGDLDRKLKLAVGNEELSEAVPETLSGLLTKRMAEVIKRYYGLDGFAEQKQVQIARDFGVSPADISSIKIRAVEKLREKPSLLKPHYDGDEIFDPPSVRWSFLQSTESPLDALKNDPWRSVSKLLAHLLYKDIEVQTASGIAVRNIKLRYRYSALSVYNLGLGYRINDVLIYREKIRNLAQLLNKTVKDLERIVGNEQTALQIQTALKAYMEEDQKIETQADLIAERFRETSQF